MKKLLVSACLAGDRVRYDAKIVPGFDVWLSTLLKEGTAIRCCPEVAGGMTTPRDPAQIVGGDGSDVLAGRAWVMDVTGRDVTEFFVRGAEYAFSLAQQHEVCAAVLKEKSPSCGTHRIYDGTFEGVLRPGFGVAAAMLTENGIKVFSEHQLAEAQQFLENF